eukprot:6214815-Pleurochrysis_carterae.AAC.4
MFPVAEGLACEAAASLCSCLFEGFSCGVSKVGRSAVLQARWQVHTGLVRCPLAVFPVGATRSLKPTPLTHKDDPRGLLPAFTLSAGALGPSGRAL